MKLMFLKIFFSFFIIVPHLTQAQQSWHPNPHLDTKNIQVLHAQGKVYVLIGKGGNITLQAGEAGATLVDTQYAEGVDEVMSVINKLTKGPVRYVINTHIHDDHIGGNEELIDISAEQINNFSNAIVAHENLFYRATEIDSGINEDAWPSATYFISPFDIFFNGEAIQVYHQPAAHTDGDSIVFFRRSDVVSAGDIFTPDRYPVIDLEQGGNVSGIIAGLNMILKITIPADRQEGGTVVIPGHGRLSDEADVVEYRDMVVIIRDRIQAMIDDGKDLKQIQAARPSLDYDTQYGTVNGNWTASDFVEAVYHSLRADN
jgi:glyoxylase-like metal-dependent hydrolase (beta-lactamase superfamily II)